MAKKQVRKATETYKTKMVVGLRGTEAWYRWLKGLAHHHRGMTIPQVIEEALILLAEKVGYKPKPPNRIERP
jgi:hypothetical protein